MENMTDSQLATAYYAAMIRRDMGMAGALANEAAKRGMIL